MNRLTKVRPDVVLANQSAELQASIHEMTLPGSGNRSYGKILEHLAAEHGIRLGRTSAQTVWVLKGAEMRLDAQGSERVLADPL